MVFSSSIFSLETFLLTTTIACTFVYLHPSSIMPLGSRHGRSTLPQVISQRILADQVLLEEDKSHWYEVDKSLIGSQSFGDRFVRLDQDADSRSFLERSVEKSDWIFTQLWHNLAKSVLSFFYSKTDVNGMLGRGSMFVLSQEQLKRLVGPHFELQDEDVNGRKHGSMIDLGAGDGCPTKAAFAPFFEKVYATEASGAMRKVLQGKEIEVLELDTWFLRQYDLVSCLNLLDRCEEPMTIMGQIREALADDGIAVVAVVLPFKSLDISGKTFEKQAESLAGLMKAEGGFEVLSWTRVPYMCEGDMAKSVYTLDDAVFVLRKARIVEL